MFAFEPLFRRCEIRSLAALAALLDATAHLASAALMSEKASPDDSQHPGWPAGAPDGQGGRFRPKDRNGAGGDVWVSPRQQPQNSGSVRDHDLSEAAKLAVRRLIEVGLLALNVEAPGLGLLLDIGLDLAERAYPYVKAYFDPPQTLESLRRAALDRQTGYDVHHVVERGTARDASEAARIHSPDNEVRIPTLKHWELNGWYARKDSDFGGMSPRDYLNGKSWDERQRVGLIGLRIIGVLK